MKITNLILISFLAILILSCNSDNEPTITETDFTISQEIKDLIYFNGDENAPIVLVNVQSGPDTELATSEVDFLVQNFDGSNFLAVNVHQAQTLNPNLINSTDITFEEAINIDAETVQVLSRVITYFKDQGRTVYVFGQSFGAFVTQELIAREGPDVADRYLIMIGRLDLNDIIWQGASEGRNGFFEDGINPVLEDEIAEDVIERNLNRLAAGFAMNRYTEVLNQYQDLSKIVYVYGRNDEVIGSLTEAEDQFLVSKNATILAGNGGHDETLIELLELGFEFAFGI